MSDNTKVTVERTIDAPVDAVFEILSNPSGTRNSMAPGSFAAWITPIGYKKSARCSR